MANSFITTTQTDDSIPTIVASQALETIINTSSIARFVNRDFENDVKSYGDTVDIPKRGTLQANSKTAGTDVTMQTPADSKVSVTLNKNYEVTFGIEDVAKIMSRPDHIAGYVRDGAKRLVAQVSNDLFALGSGFSQSVDAKTTNGRSELLEMKRKLIVAGVDPMQFNQEEVYLFAHPTAVEEWQDSDGVAFASNRGGTDVSKDGFARRLFGFSVIEDNLVPTVAGSSPTSYRNIAMSKDALTLVVRPLPVAPAGMGVMQSVATDEKSGLSVRATMSYNHKALGQLITLDILYGVAEINDEFGCQYLTD